MSTNRWLFRFGDFELDAGAYELRRKGRRLRLARQPMELLFLLVEHPRALVSREEIAKRLWEPGGLIDMDAGIHTAILRIRQVLRDSADAPRFVETVPGKGYRFVAAVTRLPTWAGGDYVGTQERPAAARRDNLPYELTSFVGRRQALADVRNLVASSRLVSLTGTGGVGKTRLMVAKAADIATKTDILLGNLEDAIPVDRKEAARAGLIEVGKAIELGETQLWTRVNALESPWVLDDLTQIVEAIGHKLAVVMVPKVEGPWDIHYVDRLLAQLEARAELTRPILVHAILETAQGVANVEEIATASPRMQGMSLGPADLAASRRMKTTRVGGGHPGYTVLGDPNGERSSAQQDLWHYTLGRMVDACAAAGILPFYGPFGDIKDLEGCEAQFRAAYLMGCVGAWSLHPRSSTSRARSSPPTPTRSPSPGRSSRRSRTVAACT